MRKPFFSVVVPCCDTASYIEKTADSLLKQSCPDFECVLIVEESRDETPELCRKIAEADPRFRLCSQYRSGSPAAARNTGIALSHGVYIVLLDGDDWLEPDALEKLKAAAEDNAMPDVIQGAANEYLEQPDGVMEFRRKLFNYLPCDGGRILSGREALIYLAELHVNPFPAAWLSVCRLDFIRKKSLDFIPGLLFEDEEWTPRVVYSAERLAVMNFAFYNYRRRRKSITAEMEKSRIFHHAAIVKSLLDFHAEHPFNPALSRAWGRNLLSFFFCFFFFPKHTVKSSGKERKSALRSVLADPRPFRKLAKHASFPKRIAAFIALTARRCTLPADLFFRFVYYPLAVKKGLSK